MKYVTLDCSAMTDPEIVHDMFAQTLDFPVYYGRNLDALYDLLSTCPELELRLENPEKIHKMLRYGDNLLLTLQDAAKANPNFTLVIPE